MSVYRNRVGQRLGSLEVVADHGRTKRGKVIWRLHDDATDQDIFLPTYRVIRLAKRLGIPAPPHVS